MIAFDSDVLIYAASTGHPFQARVLALFDDINQQVADPVGIASALLLPEVLIKPMREGTIPEQDQLIALISRLELIEVDSETAMLAVSFGAKYGLRAPDAIHLACAVTAGANFFLTNNKKDFSKLISEIEVFYPEDLPESI